MGNSADGNSEIKKKTVYDGLKITLRGANILIATLSFTILALVIFAIHQA